MGAGDDEKLCAMKQLKRFPCQRIELGTAEISWPSWMNGETNWMSFLNGWKAAAYITLVDLQK